MSLAAHSPGSGDSPEENTGSTEDAQYRTEREQLFR